MTVPITPTLHSIAIFVHDIPRAVEFYRDKLGLPLTRQGSFGAEFLEGETHVSVHPAVHKDAKSLVGRHTGITLFVPDLLHSAACYTTAACGSLPSPPSNRGASWR